MATTQEDAPQAPAREYKNHHQLEQLRFALGRLSYRDEQQNWQDVPESYTSWDDKSRYEKPWNVEQVYFTPNGIRLSQRHERFVPQVKDGRKQIVKPSYEWRVHFSDVSDILFSEFEWTPPGIAVPDRYAVVEFSSGTLSECGPWVEYPFDDPRAKPADTEDERGGVRLQPEQGPVVENAEVAEPAETEPDPATFPLAQIFNSAAAFQGKRLRITILRLPWVEGRPVNNWNWLAIVSFLGGSPFTWTTNGANTYKLPLADWAGGQKQFITVGRVKKAYPATNEKGHRQWYPPARVSQRRQTEGQGSSPHPRYPTAAVAAVKRKHEEADDRTSDTSIESMRRSLQQLVEDARALNEIHKAKVEECEVAAANAARAEKNVQIMREILGDREEEPADGGRDVRQRR
ncbi:MAG: hypothetical protein Q9178_001715 [Gyalolechia marmorata]